MSSSILREQQLADNIVGAVPGLPREAIMDTVPRSSLMATKKIVNLVPISSNSVGPSQTLQFLIPQRNLGKAHSFYLKFKLSLNGGNGKFLSYSASMQSAAALINSISVQAGGTVIEACQNYHIWHNNVLNWTQKADQLAIESATSGTALPTRYSTNEEQSPLVSVPSNSYTAAAAPFTAYAASQQQICDANTAGTYNAWHSIPIGMGFFNPKESQFLPLFQFNGGVLLTIQTNPITKAFFATNTQAGSPLATTTTAATISDYVMSDFELCYTEIQPSSEYVDAVRSGLNNGKLIKIEAQSYLNYQIACGDNIRQTLNLNCQSLSASFWGRVEQADALHTSKFFVKQFTKTDENSSAIRYEMYYDNVLLFQSPNQLNYDTVVIRQLQEALCSSITDHAVVPFVNGVGVNVGANPDGSNNMKLAGNLANQAWLYGLSNKLFASNSTSMDGTPVGTVQIQFQTTGDLPANLWYFYFVYDYMYMVDANGSVSKIM
jgi:hypothetical protein